jgi:flagella basal body P-ring formation protein FlgA
MTRLACALLILIVAGPVAADVLVAARMVRARTVISAADLAVIPGEIAGTFANVEAAIGMEARSVLYPGRPIRAADVGPPAVIDRNAVVTLVYQSGALTILAEGRALDRAAIGDRVRVLNTSSKTTIFGTVAADGSVRVAP